MSAVTLQAIFYGKSQFSIREKASPRDGELASPADHCLSVFFFRMGTLRLFSLTLKSSICRELSHSFALRRSKLRTRNGAGPTASAEQAEMTAATALFMIPTALVFPALLRKANTPPSSVTLTRVRRLRRKHVFERPSMDDGEKPESYHGRLVETQREDVHTTLAAGECRSADDIGLLRCPSRG